MFTKFVLTIATATLVAGCSLANLVPNIPQPPNPPKPPAAGSAASTNLTTSQVLSAYTQTFATPAFTNVTAAQTAGIAGFASGPTLPTAAAATSSFKTAVVKLTSDKSALEINVEGRRFNLAQHSTGTIQINGQTYTQYAFTTDGGAPGSTPKNIAGLVNGQYASLATFFRNYADKQTHPENTGFAMIATGGETPVNGMPSQVAYYGGKWFTATPVSYAEGDFTAVANFASKSLNWTATNQIDNTVDKGAATISGNRFVGNLDFGTPGVNNSAQVVGSFYGPNAEEIAGVVSGNIDMHGTTVPVGGGFIGNKNP